MWQLSFFVPALATLAYKLNELRKEEEEKRKGKPRITDIRIYPIKSCHGISLKAGKITELGFEFDRTWMVVDASTRRFLTQRQLPKMATIVPILGADHLLVQAPGMPTLNLPLTTEKEADVTVSVWDDTVKAIDVGQEAADWFSLYLNKSVRVVRTDPKEKRVADPKFWTASIPGPKLVSFADGFPFLLFSKESVQFVNDNITKGGKVELTRFRPNIVVEGVNKPFAEDDWQSFHIRGITFHAIKPCERCKITTIDQTSGEVLGDEPLATLRSARNAQNSRIFENTKSGNIPAVFGQNISHESTGYISVGDVIDVDPFIPSLNK